MVVQFFWREMSEKFSATLRIGDLNDFIAPSQGCVVSLKGLKVAPAKPEKVEVSVFPLISRLSISDFVSISLTLFVRYELEWF